MILLEIFPIALSFTLLVLMKIRKSYWESKVMQQVGRFKDLTGDERNHIVEIAEDVGISTSFVGSIFAILFAVILMLIKEYITNRTFVLFSIEFIGLMVLFVIYFVALVRLFTMKDILISRKCSLSCLQECSYMDLFTYCLYIGYVGLILMIIF